MFRRYSLQTRMLVAICGTGLLTIAATVGVVSWLAVGLAKKQATESAHAVAGRYAAMVRNDIEPALAAARTLALSQTGQLDAGVAPSREVSDQQLRAVLTGNQSFYGVWTGWEAGAYDQRDSSYAGQPGHDATGRYLPYYYRGTGGIARDVLVGYDVPGDGDYYLLSFKSGHETVLNPYPYTVDGRQILMTSLAVPVQHGGRVVGVTGVDVTLDMLHDLIKDIRIGKSGYLTVLAANQTIAAHVDAERAGKTYGEFEPWSTAHVDEMASPTGFAITARDQASGDTYLHIVSPIKFGAADQTWMVVVSLPEREVLARGPSDRDHGRHCRTRRRGGPRARRLRHRPRHLAAGRGPSPSICGPGPSRSGTHRARSPRPASNWPPAPGSRPPRSSRSRRRCTRSPR